MIEMMKPNEQRTLVHPQEVDHYIAKGYKLIDSEAPRKAEVVEAVTDQITADELKISAIIEAIELLDEKDFTTTGKPKIEPLEDVLGFEINMQERDTAWSLYNPR